MKNRLKTIFGIFACCLFAACSSSSAETATAACVPDGTGIGWGYWALPQAACFL